MNTFNEAINETQAAAFEQTPSGGLEEGGRGGSVRQNSHHQRMEGKDFKKALRLTYMRR